MPKSKSPALTQDTVLASAAARRHGHVLPLAEDVEAASPKAAKLLQAMLTAELDRGTLDQSPNNAWRSDAGKHHLLRITETGRQLVSAPVTEPVVPIAEVVSAPASPVENSRPKMPAGKLGQALAAVQSGTGASLSDLVALTGWQPHTIRASMTRLRQGGIPIELTQSDGQKRDRAEPGSAAGR